MSLCSFLPTLIRKTKCALHNTHFVGGNLDFLRHAHPFLNSDNDFADDFCRPFNINSKHRLKLADLAIELASKSIRLRRSLPVGICEALSDLVCALNCYYSNLIEGHDTHPVDIERALKGDYSSDSHKRNLQIEAQAHICVQEWIDQGGLKGRALTKSGIRGIHKRFCERLPDDLLWVSNSDTGRGSSCPYWQDRSDFCSRNGP
jgi:hypothetical protein